MVYFGLFLLDHTFIKKEENKVLISLLFRYIYKLISINFSDWVFMSKFSTYTETWKRFFKQLKNCFRMILKSSMTQKIFDYYNTSISD